MPGKNTNEISAIPMITMNVPNNIGRLEPIFVIIFHQL